MKCWCRAKLISHTQFVAYLLNSFKCPDIKTNTKTDIKAWQTLKILIKKWNISIPNEMFPAIFIRKIRL